MRSERVRSSGTEGRSRRAAQAALLALLPALVLLHGCAAELVFYGVQGAMLVAQGVDAAARESAVRDAPALATRTFAYPRDTVCARALVQAAQRDGRTIEAGFPQPGPLIVAYPASPSTGAPAGRLAVECYARGYTGLSTTVIVLAGGASSDETSRRVGEQLLDALASDIDDIARQVVRKVYAFDSAAVFDALVRAAAGKDRKVAMRDAASCSMRLSYPFFQEGRSVEGVLEVACRADDGRTIVTITGDGKGPDLEVRRASDVLLAELSAQLGLSERAP